MSSLRSVIALCALLSLLVGTGALAQQTTVPAPESPTQSVAQADDFDFDFDDLDVDDEGFDLDVDDEGFDALESEDVEPATAEPERSAEDESPRAAPVPAEPGAAEAESVPQLAAPDMPGMKTDIEEILVTGTQGETLEAAPISTTSFSASEIRQLRIQDIADLSDYTPNLEINTAFAASNPTLFIRGIGLKDYNANSAGAVAVVQDGIAINSPAGQLFQMFDVETAEVLRGPQGSMNGRNATAGAILVNSMKPNGELDIQGSLSYGNYNSVNVEGALAFPVVEDVLSSRTAFTLNLRDGTTENACSGWDPTKVGADVVNKQSTIDLYNNLGPSGQTASFYDPTPQDPNRVVDLYYWTDQALARATRASGPRRTPVGEDPNDPSAKVVTQALEIFDSEGLDEICVLGAPGKVITEQGAIGNAAMPGDYQDDILTPDLEDFQGLNRWQNNVHNWAGRTMLRYQPSENMDWLLNVHGGQNRSDSRHNQMIGASASACPLPREDEDGNPVDIPCEMPDDIPFPFRESLNAANWNEIGTQAEGSPREEAREIDGLAVPAGQGDGAGGKGGADPFKGWYDSDGKEKLDLWGFSVTGAWDVGSFMLHSVSGYEWNDRLVEDEGDASPAIMFPTEWSDTAWQVSQEIRAEGAGDRYGWMAGGYFLHEKLDASNFFPGVLSRTWLQEFDQKLYAFAPFVHGRYDFVNADNARPWLEELSLEGGLRYNWEHKTFSLSSSITAPGGGGTLDIIPEEEEKKTWRGLTGDVVLSYAPLNYEPWAYLSFYAKYSRGMKSGHFNAGLSVQPSGSNAPPEQKQSLEPVEPEFIDSVEVGLKSRWWEDRISLRAAGFRYWYQDLQVFDLVNEPGAIPTQQLLNTDADVWGAELEAELRPFNSADPLGDLLPSFAQRLVIPTFVQFGLGYLDTEFIDFSVRKREFSSSRGGGAGRQFVYDGNPLIAAPEWSFSSIVEYELPLSRFGVLVPHFDYSYRTRVFLDPQAVDLVSQPAYWLFNARLSYRTPDEKIEIAGWVRNIVDEEYLVDVFDVSREFETILQVYGDPRTFGATISYRF